MSQKKRLVGRHANSSEDAGPKTFGELNFGGARLGDARRTKRLIRIADAIMRHPGGSLPEKMGAPAELEALYHLMKWSLHTHFEVDRFVPPKIKVTPTAGGEHHERAVMDRMIESNRTYAMDRGYARFELFNRIVDAGSSYVCRIRDNSVFTVLEEKPLTEADLAAS